MLLQEGIIEEVDTSDSVSNRVMVPKANRPIRICSDLREPTKSIIPDKYPLPTFEELSGSDSEFRFGSVEPSSQVHEYFPSWTPIHRICSWSWRELQGTWQHLSTSKACTAIGESASASAARQSLSRRSSPRSSAASTARCISWTTSSCMRLLRMSTTSSCSRSHNRCDAQCDHQPGQVFIEAGQDQLPGLRAECIWSLTAAVQAMSHA